MSEPLSGKSVDLGDLTEVLLTSVRRAMAEKVEDEEFIPPRYILGMVVEPQFAPPRTNF